MVKLFLLFSAINGALVIILGAFGAHKLKNTLPEHLLAAYQTGAHYHMVHVLALLFLSLLILRLPSPPTVLGVAGYAWILGIVLFSGSLYALALGGPSWLGPITPIGGALMIIGWVCVAAGVAQLPLNSL